jgi:hypothetical protein
MTIEEYEQLPPEEKEHFAMCAKCCEIFDRRSLDEVLFHSDHKHRPDKSSDSRSSSPLTGSESVAFSTCSNASLLGSRYEVGRDVFSSVMRFFESTTLRSRSSDSRRSLLLAGSDSVAFSTCSKAFSLGSLSDIIAICTNSDGPHRIIYPDWLKKSPHTVQSEGQD